MPWLLYPLSPVNRPSTHYTGCWVGPRASLQRRKKSHPHRDLIPLLTSPWQVTKLTMLSWPRTNTLNRNNIHILLTNIDFIMIFYILSSRLLSCVIFTLLWTVSHTCCSQQPADTLPFKYAWNHGSGLNNTKVSDTGNHCSSPAYTKVLHGSQHIHKGLSVFTYLYILIGLHT
jgi:hypothetical protein